MKSRLAPLLLLSVIPVSLGFFPSVQTSSAPGLRSNRVMLFRATPYEVRPGENLSLEGSGFSKTVNKVYLNEVEIGSATSTLGAKLSIKVPSNFPEGSYKISVGNVLGSSENPKFPVSIKVTSSPQPPPVVERATLTSETVTLLGQGFGPTNTIVTNLGTASSPSSLGTTLSFRLSDLAQYNQLKKSLIKKGYQISLWVYVQNEHGVSQDPYKIDITI